MMLALVDARNAHREALVCARAEDDLLNEQPRARRRPARKEVTSWRDPDTDRSVAYVASFSPLSRPSRSQTLLSLLLVGWGRATHTFAGALRTTFPAALSTHPVAPFAEGFDDPSVSEPDMPWPSSRHDLRAPADDYYSFSDIGWQRFNGLHGRMAGYKRAAEILFDAMMASGSIADLDTVFFPYAMCWRHYVELELKGLLADLRALADLDPEDEHHHSIGKLWEGCRELLAAHFPDNTGADFQSAGRVIRQLAGMDPDGQGFRYDTRRGKPSLPDLDQVNLSKFQEAMVAVAVYLDGVTSRVDYTLDTKRDMDAYYAAEFGPSWSDYA